ncbi:MAG: cyclic nucleotide-binding domain-containing protein [Fidelibacterota bacterium]|nr:MAG: cyclic nucleotide-binding domain-containing protein [Candidatus Neomarinimicrobiota bacterium]
MSVIKVGDIHDFEILKGLTSKERDLFARRLKEKRLAAEEFVFQEGDKGGTIFFLISGEVEISQALTLPMAKSAQYDSRAKSIIRLSGEQHPLFGEVSYLSEGNERSATVKALTPCRLGVIANKDFTAILEGNPDIGYKVTRNLARIICNRLVTSNQNVLKLTTALSLILEK